MQELFMKYPVGSIVRYKGGSYRILGYEIYDGSRLLICGDGKDVFRVRAECPERGVPGEMAEKIRKRR